MFTKMFMPYPLITLMLLGVMLGYFYLAKRLNIIDLKVDRSSHSRPTIRGGGIIFPFSTLIWFILFGLQDPLSIMGLLLISTVSFLDDVKNVKVNIRILIHFAAVSMLFLEIGVLGMYWYWIVFAYILTIGCINAVNFMDGINGITALYSLVTLGTFSLLNNASFLLSPFFSGEIPDGWLSFLPERLVGILFISVFIFTFFNARKRAQTFCGDVGSISIAFIMSWFMIRLMVMSHDFFWILLFAVYGIDTSFTIMIRLLHRENIFQPHRLHLYQLLANEKRWPQLTVALFYATSQLIINAVTIWLIFSGVMNLSMFLLVLMFITITYLFIRYRVAAGKC